MEDECCSTQLIDGDGVFDGQGMEGFVRTTGLAECGLSYAVVSIMGPQSSGKSTLLNHLFKTNFREMDAFRGRNQTTKGIWIAKCGGIEPFTLVMDLEGTDGRERGEDDTAFEKQSALFALAISDIVLINMWCHDIGREQAANKPLLKTVFQVMMRLFSPRKTTLLFIIRDKTKTPLEHLEPVLREDIQKIWDGVSKPQIHKDTPFSEFFNVEVAALPSFEEKENQFKDQVAQLRQGFFHSIAPGGLAGDRRGVIPASGFSFSLQQMWKIIKENKDLDLPAHKVMVATVRCEEIANEKLSQFTSDEGWLALEEAVQSGPVLGFGKKLGAILDAYLSEYDMDAVYFDEGVRIAKREQLQTRVLHFTHPAYHMVLGHLRSKALDNFKKALEESLNTTKEFSLSVYDCLKASLQQFDLENEDACAKQADWDSSKVREKLLRDINAHSDSVRSAKLSELVSQYENQLSLALNGPVESLFASAGKDTWASIRKLFKKETAKAVSGFSKALQGFDLDDEIQNQMIDNLKEFSRSNVERKSREVAGKVLIQMKEGFAVVFSHGNDLMPRVWTGKEDIRKITKDACDVAVKLLSVMAAIRLDERLDNIENILASTLTYRTAAKEKCNSVSIDPLASSKWEEVPSNDTLITPVQCKSLWRQFRLETEYTISQAISAQEALKRGNNRMPPLWVVFAIGILGFNEFMAVLKNPLYFVGILIILLILRALSVQLGVTRHFQNGMFTGLLSLSSWFLPTIMSFLRRLADAGKRQQSSAASQYQQIPLTEHQYVEEHQLAEQSGCSWNPMQKKSSRSFKIQTQRVIPRNNSMPSKSSVHRETISETGSERRSPLGEALLNHSDELSC